MARIKITNFTQIGVLGGTDSTNWTVYRADVNGQPILTDKLFESLNDSVNKYEITATLRNSDGTLFDSSENSSVAIVSFVYKGVQQPEFTLPACGYQPPPSN